MENQHFSAMYSVQGMRKFVCDRLTEAAQEILGAFEKRAQEYESELARQRRLLESVFTPETKIRRTDLQGPPIKEEQHDISISEIQQPIASTSGQGVHGESQSLDPKEITNAGRKKPEQASTQHQETEEPSRGHAPEPTGTHDQTNLGNRSATPTKHAPKCSHGYRLPKSCVSKQINTSRNNDKPVLSSNTESSLMEVIEIMDNSPASSDIEVIQDEEEPETNQNDHNEISDAACEKLINKKSDNKNAVESVTPSPSKTHKSKSSKISTPPLSPTAMLATNQDEIEDDIDGTSMAINIGDTSPSTTKDMPSTSLDIRSECSEPTAYEETMTLSEDMLHNEEPIIENTTGDKTNEKSRHTKNKNGKLAKESTHKIHSKKKITFSSLETTARENYNADKGNELHRKHNNEERLLNKSTEQINVNKNPIENTTATLSIESSKRQTDEDTAQYACSNEQSLLKKRCEEIMGTSTANLETIQSDIYSREWNTPVLNTTTAGQERQPSQKTSEKSPFECDRCGKVLANFKNYKFHMKSHTVEKSFKCETCGKMFRESWDLNKHRVIHTGEKPFKCTDCGRGFNRRFNLDLHMRVHTGEKPYGCSSCEKAFTSRVNLKKHERIHTGEKPYTCEHCKKEFADSSSFRNHQRVHTGEKPYKCSWCKKRFATRTTLKRHIRVHTGEKPYKCSVCEKSFATNTDMKVHFRIHTGERPYKCKNCGQNFSSWTNYNRHTNIHKHSETKSTEPPVE